MWKKGKCTLPYLENLEELQQIRQKTITPKQWLWFAIL